MARFWMHDVGKGLRRRWASLPVLICLAAGVASCGDDCDRQSFPSPTPTRVPGPGFGGFAFVVNQPPPMPPTPGGPPRVTVYEVDPVSGLFNELSQAAVPNGHFGPVATAIAPGLGFLYVIFTQGQFANGSIVTYLIDQDDGSLTLARGGTRPTGAGPSALCTDPTESTVYVANTDGNSISAYEVQPPSGSLRELRGSPYAANTPVDLEVGPMGGFLYAVYGGADEVAAFDINPDGTLGENFQTVPTVTVPNALAIQPSGNYLYVAAIRSGSVGGTYGFDIFSTGELSPVDDSFFGGSGSAIAVSPNSQFVYVLTPDATVNGFEIDGDSGRLTPVAGAVVATGRFPTGITIDSTGRFAYVPNRESGTISVFALDPSSGGITPAGTIDVPGVIALALRSP